jgi:hypothetical protein
MKKKYLIPLLTVLTFLILGLPLFVYGIERTFFYSIDPDVVYVTNALLYTKYAIISYADHPGTPTITLLYYLFFPLRILSKYVLHQGFIQWSFDNYAFLTYYVRLFQLLLFSTATFVFLKAVDKISESAYILIFAWMAIFSFTGMGLAVSIVPENLSFFLTAIWLTVFVKFAKTRKYLWNVILIVIAGLAFANKFTSVFLLIASIFLPFFVQRTKLGWKMLMLEANMTISTQAFLLGVWPIRGKLMGIFEWGTSLFGHAGNYGTGASSIFDWASYSGSVLSLIKALPVLSVFLCFALILGIVMVMKKRIKISDPVIFLMATAFIGVAIFAKYPVIHYSYVNILLIIFCTAYFLSKAKIVLVKMVLPIMAILFLMTSYSYIKGASDRLRNKPPDTVQSILSGWTPFWSGDIFREQLDALSPTKP